MAHNFCMKKMITKDILSQYTCLLKEHEQVQTSIERLEKRINKMEDEGTVIDSVKGGYGGIQRFVIEGYPNDDIARQRGILRVRKAHLEQLDDMIQLKINEIESFMNSVSNSRIRLIIRLRYINGLQWEEVARQMGGGNTEDTCRKMLDRYLERESETI